MDASFDVRTGYRTVTMLVVRIEDSGGQDLRRTRAPELQADGGAAIASLETIKYEVVPFPERYQELAASLASQAAVALENARLYEEIERSYQELSGTEAELASRRRWRRSAAGGGVAHDFNNLLTRHHWATARCSRDQLAAEHPAARDVEEIIKRGGAGRRADPPAPGLQPQAGPCSPGRSTSTPSSRTCEKDAASG